MIKIKVYFNDGSFQYFEGIVRVEDRVLIIYEDGIQIVGIPLGVIQYWERIAPSKDLS